MNISQNKTEVALRYKANRSQGGFVDYHREWLLPIAVVAVIVGTAAGCYKARKPSSSDPLHALSAPAAGKR